jgi:micrococcal nuclease
MIDDSVTEKLKIPTKITPQHLWGALMIHLARSIPLVFFIAACFVLQLASTSHAQANLPKGEDAVVTEIVDGDTIRVTIGDEPFTVRYIGIDSPEMIDNERPQCYAREATNANRILVNGQTLRLVKDRTNVDRYGRLLRYAFLPNGLLVNEALVRDGFAFAKRYKPDTRRATQLERAQAAAKRASAGLWGACDVAALLKTQPAPLTSAPAPATSQNSVTAVPSQNPAPQPVIASPVDSRANCDPSYPSLCIPIGSPDLDCGDIAARRFPVLPPDPHRFDRDKDGVGCESG